MLGLLKMPQRKVKLAVFLRERGTDKLLSVGHQSPELKRAQSLRQGDKALDSTPGEQHGACVEVWRWDSAWLHLRNGISCCCGLLQLSLILPTQCQHQLWPLCACSPLSVGCSCSEHLPPSSDWNVTRLSHPCKENFKIWTSRLSPIQYGGKNLREEVHFALGGNGSYRRMKRAQLGSHCSTLIEEDTIIYVRKILMFLKQYIDSRQT